VLANRRPEALLGVERDLAPDSGVQDRRNVIRRTSRRVLVKVTGTIEGHRVALGNAKLVADLHVAVEALAPQAESAMSLSSVSVIGNALRLRRVRL
jgi:cation transport ATPase